MMDYLEIEENEIGWVIKEPDTGYEINLLERTFEFAINVLGTLKTVGYVKEMDVVRYQLAKSGTSVGANYEEAQGASSKKDFSNKINIVYRELRESHFWARILKRMNWGNRTKVEKLVKECNELRKIFGQIRQTLRNEENKL